LGIGIACNVFQTHLIKYTFACLLAWFFPKKKKEKEIKKESYKDCHEEVLCSKCQKYLLMKCLPWRVENPFPSVLVSKQRPSNSVESHDRGKSSI
jgi:hypothetical protein